VRRRKKTIGVDLGDPDTVMLASLVLTRYAWQTECQLRGWREDSPIDIVSLVNNASNFALHVFGIDISNTSVGELLSDKKMLSAGLRVDNEVILQDGDPDLKIVKELSSAIETSPGVGLQKTGKLTVERIKRDASRLEGKFN
jgi:hypothetical protein